MRVDAAAKEAQGKSGLTLSISTEIGRLVSEYIPQRTMGTDEDKKKARVDFEQKYGAAAAAAMDKHEAELVTLQDEIAQGRHDACEEVGRRRTRDGPGSVDASR